MKYATWKIHFLNNAATGTTPESFIRDRGGSTSGITPVGEHRILGLISDEADISNLDEYEINILSTQQAYDLLFSIDNRVTLENNIIKFPPLPLRETN